MKSLSRTARGFESRIVEQWSYPVKIGLGATAGTLLAIIFPAVERNFTQISIYRLLTRQEQWVGAAILALLLVAACLFPYWGGVVCTLLICPIRIVAYAQTPNLTVYIIYGSIMATTILAVRRRYRLSKWVAQQKERCNATAA